LTASPHTSAALHQDSADIGCFSLLLLLLASWRFCRRRSCASTAGFNISRRDAVTGEHLQPSRAQ
jgi:hypothetical protein